MTCGLEFFPVFPIHSPYRYETKSAPHSSYISYYNILKVLTLLKNDDGPPDSKESPYVLGLYRHLTEDLGMRI